MPYKNKEGYRDPTAGEAIRAADRMPRNIHEIYKKLNQAAGVHGLEVIGLRDKYTKKEWVK